MFKKITALIIAAVVCMVLPSCAEKEGDNFIFKYDIPDNPRTLDPQTATGRTSALLISNLYDGLLKIDRSGNITANIAAEYEVSADGLTYTFLLRDDVYWFYDGDDSIKCTAYDFVFAFRRLFNPAVKSENAESFYCIKNAESVHKGRIPYLDAVGVEAHGDFELIITLEYPNPLLPYLLTTSPAMPCNEELFGRTAGRYGLNENNIPSNGAFYITRWNYDPFSTDNNVIIMRRNEKNSEAERIYPRGLNFFIGESVPFENFTSGNTHSIITEGDDAAMLISRNVPYDSFENSVWGITFNVSVGRVFGNDDLRHSLATGFDRNAINPGKYGWREADGIIPPLINHRNQPYRIAAGSAETLKFNAGEARAAFGRGISEVSRENMAGVNVIIPAGNDTAFEYLSRILQQWQSNIGFFCVIQPLTEYDFTRAVTSGDFDIAFIKITGEYNSPDAYLSRFGHNARSRPSHLREHLTLLEEAGLTTDMQKSAELYAQAEKTLINQAVFVPVCFQTEMFFYNRRSRDLLYNPFTGTIHFREAKYF